MNSTSLQIKKLNDRLLTQNVIIQTLINILIESELVTEKELQTKIEDNLDDIQDIINSIEITTSDDKDDKDDSVMSSMYFGPHGEA